MDSKNIYIGCNVMMRKAEWEKLKDNNEWQFIGEGKDFLLEVVQVRVNEFFSGQRVFLYWIVISQKKLTKKWRHRK